ncbi:hypothetical protein CSE899_13035, partial [Cronobacter sakazakii E899]
KTWGWNGSTVCSPQPSRLKRQLRLLRYLGWHYTGRL